ncbi:MAG: hypothetical protein J0H94_04460 [Rhizobiales bacterium]|nr:hypothetical protein [Hyphomicrobiales bacterium]
MFGNIILGTILGAVKNGALGKGAWKAHAAGAAGAILTTLQPALDACGGALQSGAGDIGADVGRAVVGYLLAFVVTWIAPKNKLAAK